MINGTRNFTRFHKFCQKITQISYVSKIAENVAKFVIMLSFFFFTSIRGWDFDEIYL